MIELNRETTETKIDLKLKLYGEGNYDIKTGIGFFDHMLELWSKHGFFDLKLEVKGDLEVDEHHTVEDTAIMLGKAINKELGNRAGITRYADIILPMDESLIMTAVDLGGRSYYKSDFQFQRNEVGGFAVELVDEFFRSLVSHAKINLHFQQLRGENTHHIIEGAFKAFARTLDKAIREEKRLKDKPLSTKGRLQEGGRH
ncbi:MAG: imidazoleglycerol-phosphate dehydratase HisB [Bacillota bacterium]